MIAVDKPAGVLTVPGRGVEAPALSALVREIAPDALPVHRLDRDTSGVVLFAATRDAHRALNAAFESRRAEKTYLALARGDLATPQRVELALAETRGGRMRAVERGGLPARTDVTPSDRFGAYTLCTCIPKTGRMHQIRVHLAAIGHPVLGDPVYGRTDPRIDRPFLHAAELAFTHPVSGVAMRLQAPWPADLEHTLASLGPPREA